MENAHMLRLQRSYKRYLATIKLGVLETQIMDDISSQYRIHTTQPLIRFVKRWRR